MDRTTKPSVLNRSNRPNRVSITGYRDKLTVEGQEAGFHYCWVRDDNVARFERASYEFVTHDVIVGDVQIATSTTGGKVSVPGGNGVTLFLMRIPDEYHREDMEAEQTDVAEKESDMFRTLNSGQDGQYGKVKKEIPGRG